MQVQSAAAPAPKASPAAPSSPSSAAPAAAPASPPPEAATPEAPVDAKPEGDAAQDPKFARAFAALTKRERGLVVREKALKEREADPDFAAFKKAKEGAKENPVELLKAHGWSFDDVTNFILSDGKLSPEQKIAKLEKAIEDERKAREDEKKAKATAEEQAVYDQHRQSIREHVDAGGEAFELIRENDAYEAVFDVIQQHWADTGGEQGGEIMPIDQAAKAVEDFLYERASAILKLKKFQPKEATPPATPAVNPDPAPTTAKPASPTLTNRAAAQVAPPPKNLSDLSDEDSKREAAKLLRWT